MKIDRTAFARGVDMVLTLAPIRLRLWMLKRKLDRARPNAKLIAMYRRYHAARSNKGE